MSNKDDCISRRAAIAAITDELMPSTPLSAVIRAKNRLKELPSVQPDHNADIGKKVSISYGHENDLISRQAARHALCKAVHNGEDVPCENQAASCLWTGTRVCDFVREIDALPPARPESSTDIDNALALLDGIHSAGRMEYYSDYCALHDAISQISVQPDHTADIGKKVSISCGQENDLISRQAATSIPMPKEHRKIFKSIDDAFETGWNEALSCVNMLPSAQPEQRWIPVTERLPERADNVIICYKAGDYTLVSTGRYLYKFKMWYVDVVGDLRDGVTAWMPLPEPYRGGDSNE